MLNLRKRTRNYNVVQETIEQSGQRVNKVSCFSSKNSDSQKRRGGRKKKRKVLSYSLARFSRVFNYESSFHRFQNSSRCPDRSPISRSAAYVVSIFHVSVRLLFSRISDVPPFSAIRGATSGVIRSPDTFEGARDLPRYQLQPPSCSRVHFPLRVPISDRQFDTRWPTSKLKIPVTLSALTRSAIPRSRPEESSRENCEKQI